MIWLYLNIFYHIYSQYTLRIVNRGTTEMIFTSFNKNILVGKMEIIIIRFHKVSLVGKITVIFISLSKILWSVNGNKYYQLCKRYLAGQMEMNTFSFGNISSVDKIKKIVIGSYIDTLVGSNSLVGKMEKIIISFNIVSLVVKKVSATLLWPVIYFCRLNGNMYFQYQQKLVGR